MVNKIKACEFKPTGKKEELPKFKLDKDFWRQRWVEASGDHLMEFLRAEKLQKENDAMEKALKKLANPFRKNVQYKKEAEEVLAALEGERND